MPLHQYKEPSKEELQKAGLAPYCPCGSGELREAQYDGYGIFLTYTCHKCHDQKISGYRSDIHEAYDTDEEIWGEEDY